MKLIPAVFFLATSSVTLRETELVWKTMWEDTPKQVIKQKQVTVESFEFDIEKVEFKAKLKRTN
jgi:hypothetical protein